MHQTTSHLALKGALISRSRSGQARIPIMVRPEMTRWSDLVAYRMASCHHLMQCYVIMILC
eukprot:747769-Prorocentrum_minimum.AAC.1